MKKQPKSSNQVVTFGCRLNAYESEAIKQALEKSSQENLIVFNSCAVTNEAEKELRQAVRKARKNNPEAKIIVTGCAAQIDPQKYAKMAEVDLVLGNAEKSRPESYSGSYRSSVPNSQLGLKNVNSDTEILRKDEIFFATKKSEENFLRADETAKILVNDIMSVRETAPHLVSYFENQTRAFLEIQNGCNHRCTFCIIPYGRGNSRSVAFGEIVEQVKKMVASGHQEVVFTGVDISDYGKDLASPIGLLGMIKRLFKLVPELPRLRLSSIDVAEIGDEIFELLATEPRFMPHLHLSIQSGDDMILKRMKRRHNRQQVLDFCAKARQIRPNITFGADIIAGFPTETDEMFLNSVNLMEETGIVFAHIFPYSKKVGTPAAKMPQVAPDVIKKRAKILRETGEKNLRNFLEQQIGKTHRIIIEQGSVGKTENFLSVKISENSGKLEGILDVKIVGTDGLQLVGERT